jgi:hypothetical protein
VHHVPLNNKESRHQTGHQTFIIIIIIIIVYLNCASGAAPQHWVAAPDETPYFFTIISIFFIYFNCASCAASQQVVATAARAPDFYYYYYYYYHYYYCLFELCIRCRSTTMESLQQTGHQSFFPFQSILIYVNCASGVAPRHSVAAPYGAPDSSFSTYLFNLFEFCISCRSTAGSRSTRRDTRLVCVVNYLFYIIWMVHQVPHHNKKSGHQTGR